MNATFKIWKRSRQIITNLLDTHSLEQLHTIPNGFTNNLIWNIGHVIVVQQKLVYKTSNVTVRIPEYLFEYYTPGTSPIQTIHNEHVQELKQLLTSCIENTIADYNTNTFHSFREITTGTGFHLGTIEEALEFNNFHEALHIGLMMNIKKFV